MGADLSSKVPVVLLTGFLGSGKTTLLRRILNHPGMAKTAVLINEFGEIGLDHLLVKAVHGDTIVLQNGCICCRLQADLRTGLRGLIDGRGKDDATGEFDRIVIETTGLADPAPILRTIMLDPMLKHQVRLETCVATIDAQHAAGQIRDHEEAASQAAAADRLVITKSDLVPKKLVSELVLQLASINPTSRLFHANDPDFDPLAVIGGGLSDESARLTEVARWFRGVATAPAKAAANREIADVPRAERHQGQGNRISSFSLRITTAIDWTAFGVWLTAFLHRHGENVLRVKGLLNVSDTVGPVVLHGVQNVIYPPVHLDEWPDEDRSSRVVFIVKDLEPERIRRSLFAFLSAAQGGSLDVHAA